MSINNTYLFGRYLNKTDWTAAELSRLGEQARAKTAGIKGASREYILDTLSKAGKMFADKNSGYRKAALKHLAENITFSGPMIEKSLDILPEILDKNFLLKRMSLELFLPYAMETAVERRGYDGLVRAVPKGVVLHVGAGNVFLGIIDSLILGLLTKNVNLVKMSSSGSRFANIFVSALKEADEKGVIAGSIAVVNWKGGKAGLEEAILARVDSVFVWGGYDAVASYRQKAPIHVRVEGFGPKTSLGIVFESAVQNEGYAAVASKAVLDVGLWDQAACSSLHTLYLICPDRSKFDKTAGSFLAAAKKEFSDFQRELPQGRLSPDEQVEITRARELAKVDKALGAARCESSFPATDWTVIYEKDPVYRVSPLNRVLYVKCVSSLEEIKTNIAPFKGYLQTVGVAGNIGERKKVLETLYEAGIARVVRLGRMLDGANGSPHDGIFPMTALVNWIGIEERPTQLDRLNELVTFAKSRSVFYRKHFKKLGRIVTFSDFEKAPLLEKRHIYENTPPESTDLMTAPVRRGIYFASGGSTGSPKYVFYDAHEYDLTCRLLARTIECGGLDERDIAANLFVAGNLWSSWLSVEKALAYTKAISVPIGSNLPVEDIVRYLEDFKVNAVIGLPSFLIKLAEFAEAGKGKHSLSINKIFYGGEYVGLEMVKFFQRVFPGVAVRSAGFATADAGVVGFQCAHCLKGAHHLFDNSQYLEFVDPDTLKPVKKGSVGEILITSLTRKHMPIIRFRLGDLGRWILKPCGCGRKEPLFEILGRCDDKIHAGGAHLFVSDIQNAIGKVPELSFNFQVVIDKKGHKDALALKVEAKSGAPLTDIARKNLQKWLLDELEKNCGDLKESIRMKWLDKPEIEILKPGTIERILRTGKIRKVIDRRVKVNRIQ
ncbi:MAG: AMP-binding protein [Elusimicrobia bacterium]|nr:AMP-binding protein [Elusimicrobiota bacterium]